MNLMPQTVVATFRLRSVANRFAERNLKVAATIPGSWPVSRSEWNKGLPMNPGPSSRPSPPAGEKVPPQSWGRLRGIRVGSWTQGAFGKKVVASPEPNTMRRGCLP